MIGSEMIERWAASIQAAAVKRNEELIAAVTEDLGAGCTDEAPWVGRAFVLETVDGPIYRSLRVDVDALPDDPREARQVLAAQMQLAGDQLWAVIQKRKGWDG